MPGATSGISPEAVTLSKPLLADLFTGLLETEPHEKTEERKGYRNSYKSRSLVARAGAQSPDGPLTLMAASGQPVTQSMHPLQKYAKRATIR